jgi:hypothetical protein
MNVSRPGHGGILAPDRRRFKLGFDGGTKLSPTGGRSASWKITLGVRLTSLSIDAHWTGRNQMCYSRIVAMCSMPVTIRMWGMLSTHDGRMVLAR